MIRYSHSFFLSLFVHLLLLVLLFFTYKQLVVEKSKSKEKITCIKLNCLSPKIDATSTPQVQVLKPKKKVHTKKVKNKVKKVVKKRVEKKKTVVVKKEKKVLKKRVQEESVLTPIVQKEQVVEKTIVKQTAMQKTPSKTTLKPITKSPSKVKKFSAQEKYIEENLAEIVALLKENLHYPRRARKRGKEGIVKIKFKLSKNAEISNIQIVESKSEILSRGAIKTLENLSFKLPPPKEELILNVPISYKLR